jgi:hypothetical protein
VEVEFDTRVAAAIHQALGDHRRGHRADRPDLHGDLPGVPAALGRGLARIHHAVPDEPVEPFDLARVLEQHLVAGRVDTSSLPDPYRRYGAAELVEIWRRWPQPVTASGPAVCSVGRLSVDRMLLSDGEVVDIGGGPFGLMADRHLDLAVLHHSLHLTLGADAVFGFYEAYGTDPDLVVLDRHVLYAHLLGWMPTDPS